MEASFIGDGVTAARGIPVGVPACLGQYFFMMTGFHGTHVLIGRADPGDHGCSHTSPTRIDGGEASRLAGLYWHFVDLVWVFIFTLFYLI